MVLAFQEVGCYQMMTLPLGVVEVEVVVVVEEEAVVEALKLAFEWAAEEAVVEEAENDVDIVPELFDY